DPFITGRNPLERPAGPRGFGSGRAPSTRPESRYVQPDDPQCVRADTPVAGTIRVVDLDAKPARSCRGAAQPIAGRCVVVIEVARRRPQRVDDGLSRDRDAPRHTEAVD